MKKQSKLKDFWFLSVFCLVGLLLWQREPLLKVWERVSEEYIELIGEAVAEKPVWRPEAGAQMVSGDKEGILAILGKDPDKVPVDTNEEIGVEPTKPVWAYDTATASYFDDAVFIGDSRTVGLQEYSGLENTSFYASTGLTVYKLFDAKIVPDENGKKITIEEALSKKQFSKIYFMIGINEMGTGNVDSFMVKYGEVIEHLKELQPNALIYIQSIMCVTKERSEQGDYITNEGIFERNERIAQLADGEKVFYLDVNPLVEDETGGMDSDYTYDGVHLKAEYISIWKDFLLQHTIKFLDVSPAVD